MDNKQFFRTKVFFFIITVGLLPKMLLAPEIMSTINDLLAKAIVEKKYETIEFLLRNGADPEHSINNKKILEFAIDTKDHTLAATLLTKKANPNAQSLQTHQSLLLHAAEKNAFSIVQLLVIYGAHIDTTAFSVFYFKNNESQQYLEICTALLYNDIQHAQNLMKHSPLKISFNTVISDCIAHATATKNCEFAEIIKNLQKHYTPIKNIDS